MKKLIKENRELLRKNKNELLWSIKISIDYMVGSMIIIKTNNYNFLIYEIKIREIILL